MSGVRTGAPKTREAKPRVSTPMPRMKSVQPLGGLRSLSPTEKGRLRSDQARTRPNGPSLAEKNKAKERKAEQAARNKLYYNGYDHVYKLQHNKANQGIDLGAIKVDRRGKATEGAVSEVKWRNTRRGPGTIEPQMLPSYYQPRLAKASQAGVRGAATLQKLDNAGQVKSLGMMYSPDRIGKGPRVLECARNNRGKGPQIREVSWKGKG